MTKKYMVLAVLLLCFGFAQVARSQDDESTLYEKAFNEKDPAKKQAALIEFVQKVKKGSAELEQGVSSMMAQLYVNYRQAGSWAAMASAAEKFLTYRPGDDTSVRAATEAYQKLGNPQKLAEFGTKLYNQSPNANTAYFVAKAYQATGDNVNFSKWADKTLQHDPNNLEMNAQMVDTYLRTNDFAKASATGQKLLTILGTYKNPGGMTEDQWKVKADQIRAFSYRAIGENAYRNNDVPGATKNFEAASKLEKGNDYAYFRLGELYHRGSRVNEAILAYAKAYVISGPTSVEAQKRMTDLYKGTHNNTTNGLNDIIGQARQMVR